jgi:anaerobic magnesium-protoporphyrin IX monomethyl ester cyclase
LPGLYAVVVGEGESALLSLVKPSLEQSDISGVFRRDQGGLISGEGQTPRENLDVIATPAWRWCRGRGFKSIPLSTMRGCPFSCSFCDVIAFLGRRVTRMSIDGILDNLRVAMEAVGSNDVSVVDDTFTVSARHVETFCTRLIKEKIDLRFSIFSRTDTISTKQMELLAAAGCRRIFFGLDSGDDDILKMITKNMSISPALRTVKEAAEFFPVTASFIWGYPFEGWTSFDRTVGSCSELLNWKSPFPITPQLHLLSPSAGTPLFESHKGELIFNGEAECLALSGALASRFELDAYGEVLDVIRTEPLLAAPFYRFKTPSFSTKHYAASQFDKMVQTIVGARVIDAMKAQIGDCNDLRA